MLCFEVDLTSRTLRRADPDFLAMLRLDNTADYMQLLQAMGEQVLLPGDREMFITRMTGERLACCFRAGTKLVQFDVADALQLFQPAHLGVLHRASD